MVPYQAREPERRRIYNNCPAISDSRTVRMRYCRLRGTSKCDADPHLVYAHPAVDVGVGRPPATGVALLQDEHHLVRMK